MRSSDKRPVKMCIVTAQASTIEVLYRGQLEFLQRNGFDITVVCGATDNPENIRSRGLSYHPIAILRKIAPLSDVMAIIRLRRFLRRHRFDLVQACTPKGGLVGVLAARLARVPLVIHLLRGLAYERQAGLSGWLIKRAARATCRSAHHVIAIADSLKDLALADGICRDKNVSVLGSGSSNGVDLARFSPDRIKEGRDVRRAHGISNDALVLGFVGRIVRDKGIVELIDAFGELSERHKHLRLLILGTYEPRDAPPARVRRTIESHPRIVRVDWLDDPVPYYAAMDMLALPSYREGFGNVAIEASAMQVPVVASDTVGCRDGTLDGRTGLLVPVGSAGALTDALERLIVDVDLRRNFGAAGRARVERRFDQRKLWPLYVQLYAELLRGKCPDLDYEMNLESESA